MSTYPSKKITVVDVPTVRSPSAKFRYHFFVRDEALNDSGTSRIENLVKSGEFSTPKVLNQAERFAPRDVEIRFTPPSVPSHQNEFITNVGKFSFGKGIGIENFIDKIYDERIFSNSDFTVMNLQDTGIDGKLFFFVSGSVAARVDQKNQQLTTKIEDVTQDIVDVISSTDFSLLDAAKSLYTETPGNVSGDFLVRSLNRLDRLGARFIDDETEGEIVEKTFDRVKNFSLKSQISNRFLSDILRTVAKDPSSIYADEALSFIPAVDLIQKKSATSAKIEEISLDDYDLTIVPISYRTVDITTFESRMDVVGYVIDKWELMPNGKSVKRDPVIVNSPSVNAAVDTRVKYGSTYIYSIRTIAMIETQASSPESGDIVAASFLISSKSSRKVRATCVENVPPPPPTDLTGYWDFDTETMTLNWAYPVNPQRDVKKFQIFRRVHPGVPFQLIKEFNFDDSMVKAVQNEAPKNSIVTNKPVNLYTDYDFTKDSRFIYSICAIDAHGMTSNYSAQIEISFDRSKNCLVKKMISVSGAPKSYPNILLKNNLFENVMKASGKSRVSVYFNPEYLEVTNNVNQKMGLLGTDTNGGTYRIQVTNTDLQKAASVDIHVKNFRTDI